MCALWMNLNLNYCVSSIPSNQMTKVLKALWCCNSIGLLLTYNFLFTGILMWGLLCHFIPNACYRSSAIEPRRRWRFCLLLHCLSAAPFWLEIVLFVYLTDRNGDPFNSHWMLPYHTHLFILTTQNKYLPTFLHCTYAYTCSLSLYKYTKHANTNSHNRSFKY